MMMGSTLPVAAKNADAQIFVHNAHFLVHLGGKVLVQIQGLRIGVRGSGCA